MPGSINQIQNILLSIVKIVHLNRMAFDRNAPFPFQVHVVKHLCLKVSFRNCVSHLKKAISQGAFPMINMGYDTEITDVFHIYKVTLYDSPFTTHHSP